MKRYINSDAARLDVITQLNEDVCERIQEKFTPSEDVERLRKAYENAYIKEWSKEHDEDVQAVVTFVCQLCETDTDTLTSCGCLVDGLPAVNQELVDIRTVNQVASWLLAVNKKIFQLRRKVSIITKEQRTQRQRNIIQYIDILKGVKGLAAAKAAAKETWPNDVEFIDSL